MNSILCSLALVLSAHMVCAADSLFKDYCVVGAGPSGLQLGSFLQTSGRDYIIFEKGHTAGHFYIKYPRHGTLISINKRNTGKTNDEFNMRHDWNSLLTDNLSLRMTKYSKKFFPPKETLVEYLSDFAKYYDLNIKYNTTVSEVTPPAQSGGKFQLQDQHANVYTCNVVVMATGYSMENTQRFPGWEHTTPYSTVSTNPDDFEGKTVLILGRGNSAFETADRILGSTNLVHMISRSRIKLSWETHYVGDLRAINNGILDTYQLKSLDALAETPVSDLQIIKQRNGRLKVITDGSQFDNFAVRDEYDEIITCLGFQYDFSVFNLSGIHPRPHKKYIKFPSIKHNYESKDVPDIYFAGTSTHSLDFKKSAGGFIHGYRYTTRSLFNLLEWKYQGVHWPSVTRPWPDMLNSIAKRINEASGTYQMFGVLGDLLLINDDDQTFATLEEFPLQLISDIHTHSGHNATTFILMLFEYGKDFSGPGKDIFRTTRATGEPSEGHLSNFLHPTFYYYKTPPTDAEMKHVRAPEILPRPDRLHHTVEDFLTEFDAPSSHMLPLRRYLETSLGTDLRHRFADECFELALTHKTLPVGCLQSYMRNQGISLTM